MDPDRRKGMLIVAAGALLFAPDGLLLRLMAMEQYPTMFWRGLLAGGVLTLGFLAARGLSYLSDIRALGWDGVGFALCYSGTTIGFVFAVRETAVANALFLLSTSPVFSALLSWAILGERPSLRMARTIVMAMIGVGVIASGHDADARPAGLLGDAAAMGAAFFLALSFVFARRVRPRAITPLMGPGALITAAIGFVMADSLAVPDHALWPMLLMGLVVLPVGAWCLSIGPRYIPAADVSLLLLIEAAVAPILVWIALGEDPGIRVLWGGAIILGALAWSSLEARREVRV